MGKMIGIDLGTTNTVVAIMDGPRPKVIDSFESKPEMRSVVSLKKPKGRKGEEGKEERLVGDTAFDNWPMAPLDTIVSVKRLMGRGVTDPEVQRVRECVGYHIEQPRDGTGDSVCVVMGGLQYTPSDISAMILERAKKAAEYREGTEVTHAVITVPAYFSHSQKDATRKAAILAGLKVIKILDEPTAAAIAFGAESPDGSPRTLLVYDLGGGTFDVSVLMLAGSVFAPLDLQGDMWLGGDDFDQAIVDHALECIQKDYGIDPRAERRFMVELKKSAQRVKERLSSGHNADLVVTGLLRDGDGDLIDIDIPFTRAQFERLIVSLIGHYHLCSCNAVNLIEDSRCCRCGKVLSSGQQRKGKALLIVDKALEKSGLTRDQVDYVIMAGNSTMVPLVQESMEREFGPHKVLRKIHPKQCVALGAAITAAYLGGRVVCQAPDPKDPKVECGEINDQDAAVCRRCGNPLGVVAGKGLGATDKAGDNGTSPLIINVGNIAPFSYGTQSTGDKFNVFIQKGDTYPTPVENEKSMTFYTRFANQRMVSIPVYGGDNEETASANERQGEAFVVLPRGLSENTQVRILMTLDSDGVFKIGAWLGSGTDLKPWIVKGGSDARVIQLIEEINEKLGDAGTLSSAKRAATESDLETVYAHLKTGRVDDALREAQQIINDLDTAEPGNEPLDVFQQARAMEGYAEYILGNFGWAFNDPRALARLELAVKKVTEALRRRERSALDGAVAALEFELDRVPNEVKNLMGIVGAILGQIRPANPALGEHLHQDFNGAMEDFKRGNFDRAGKCLGALVERVEEALGNASNNVIKCGNCGADVPAGKRRCPKCNADQWIMGQGGGRYVHTM
ncbi:MAG: Hsp70 family protein [Candidatus Accumulibacter phosphatis]|jgi:molecular chaperone DnaK